MSNWRHLQIANSHIFSPFIYLGPINENSLGIIVKNKGINLLRALSGPRFHGCITGVATMAHFSDPHEKYSSWSHLLIIKFLATCHRGHSSHNPGPDGVFLHDFPLENKKLMKYLLS